jgi:polysaccharide export outer membrane protein
MKRSRPHGLKRFGSTVVVLASIGLAVLPIRAGAASESVAVSPDSEYRLGPEDVLQISVWKDESLTREVLVRPDGMISFPLIGEVRAEGRTAGELQKDIRAKLSPYIPDPTVSVAVTKVNSYKIYVVGKVNRPGEYLVGHYTNVMQALSLAGGMTPFASENGIRVLHAETDGQQVSLFHYGDVKKGRHLEENIVLQRGDVIVVP